MVPTRTQSDAALRSASHVLPGERMALVPAVLLLLACLPFFLGLDHTFWGSETRWAFISRNMLASGDWLEPRLYGDYFYGDKPLLSYWLVALVAAPLGGVSEFTARLPSALAASGAVLVTGWLAARLLGARWSLAAGAVLATSYGYLSWARVASADPLNLLFITAAIAVYVEWLLHRGRWCLPAFFCLLAAGGHAKGTPAILIPVSVVGVDVLLARRWELLREAPRIALWTAVAALVYLAPFGASYLDRGDARLFELMLRENFTRALDAYDHVNPPWYYLGILPLYLLPWTLWLPGGLVAAAGRARERAGVRFALLAFLVIVAVFSASESRRSYYILPALPFAALVLAASWQAAVEALGSGAARAALWRASLFVPAGLFALLLVGVALVALLKGGAHPGLGPIVEALPGLVPVALVLLALGAALVAASVRRRPLTMLVAAGLGAWLIALYFATGVQALREQRKQERQVAAQLLERFPDERVFFYHGAIGPLRWYVGGEDVARERRDVRDALGESGAHALVACSASSCREGFPDERRLVCLPVLDSASPAIGAWIEARDQYRVFRCVRR